mmetsp:Transcript_33122/g.77547  ORF Transcript_33122/g.77547 Transcript_33122/m.77547 type:complete len:201 (-) Transcript_33122:228-830(-)
MTSFSYRTVPSPSRSHRLAGAMPVSPLLPSSYSLSHFPSAISRPHSTSAPLFRFLKRTAAAQAHSRKVPRMAPKTTGMFALSISASLLGSPMGSTPALQSVIALSPTAAALPRAAHLCEVTTHSHLPPNLSPSTHPEQSLSVLHEGETVIEGGDPPPITHVRRTAFVGLRGRVSLPVQKRFLFWVAASNALTETPRKEKI